MNKKAKQKIIKGILAGTAGASTIAVATGAYLTDKAMREADLTPLSERFEQSQIDTSGYSMKLKEKYDYLYNQLVTGEISIDQFKNEYLDFTNSYTIEAWTNEQVDNPQIQEIITDYNSDSAEYKSAVGTGLTTALLGGFALGLSGLTYLGGEVIHEAFNLDEEQEEEMEK